MKAYVKTLMLSIMALVALVSCENETTTSAIANLEATTPDFRAEWNAWHNAYVIHARENPNANDTTSENPNRRPVEGEILCSQPSASGSGLVGVWYHNGTYCSGLLIPKDKYFGVYGISIGNGDSIGGGKWESYGIYETGGYLWSLWQCAWM